MARSVSPYVAAEARRLGVNVDDIATGTGVGGRVTLADVRGAAAASKPVTAKKNAVPPAPHVAREADRLGVNIDEVTGTGVAGRVTLNDVRKVAAARKPAATVTSRPRAAVAPAAGAPRAVTVTSAFTGAPVTIDPYGRNPLLDDLRQTSSGYAAAVRDSTPPTLFETGDLPPFTASGIDPQMLLRLPWQARHPAARDADGGRVFRLFATYELDPVGAAVELGGDDGNQEYEWRMRGWASGFGFGRTAADFGAAFGTGF